MLFRPVQEEGLLDRLPEFAERLAAPLILEDGVRQLEGMADAVRVELGPETLRDDVDEIVLEVLGDSRDERDTDGSAEEQADTAKELPGGELLEFRRVLVDDVPEYQRIEQREDLIDGRKNQRESHQAPIAAKIGQEQYHRGSGTGGPECAAIDPA